MGGKERACEREWGEERDAGVEVETGKGKVSRLDQEPAGQMEGNESLDGPRRAVQGAGVLEGRGGRRVRELGAVSLEAPGSRWPPAGRRMGEERRLAGRQMDGQARWGGWEGGRGRGYP